MVTHFVYYLAINVEYNNFFSMLATFWKRVTSLCDVKYTERLFESLLHIVWAVQGRRNKFLMPSLSTYIQIHSAVDKSIGQEIKNETHLGHSRCWKLSLFITRVFLVPP
jgi:hypothetical protein